MKQIGACVAKVRRTQQSGWEDAIAISDTPGVYEVHVMVDMSGQVIPAPVYNYELLTHLGCFIHFAPVST